MVDPKILIEKSPNIISTINKNTDDIEDIYNQIDDINNNIDLLDSVVTAPKISYPSQAMYSSTINLIASSSITAFKDNGSDIDKYIWTLPDNTTLEGTNISYTMPDDTHIGETITIKCRAKDILGNYSKYTYVDILVADYNHTPIIDNIFWDNDIHNASNSYTLTIDAHDPDTDDTLSYSVTANDDNIIIVQDPNNPNKFTVTYPNYNDDVIIDYTIKVTDMHDATYTYVVNPLVYHSDNQAPIIDSITWDNDNHIENNSYMLTINAHDPDDTDVISNYNITASDPNINITQNLNNKNKFTITYPEYLNDLTIIYTITVTNNCGLSTSTNLSQLVHNNKSPIIDDIIWDNDIHYADNSYILTIIAHSLNDNNTTLSYAVTVSDNNINIIQDIDNPNIFTITYPNYLDNTLINYTIKVIDDLGFITNKNINKLVYYNNNNFPIINNISWDNDDQYENNSYTFTINAYDPDNNDELTYELFSPDNKISIEQDAINKNVFTVTYRDYDIDTIANLDVKVTDNNNKATLCTINHLVKHINEPPIIDNIYWDNDTQYDDHTYLLTIDAHDPDNNKLFYNVICNDKNVSIIQDPNNPNKFNVTYPQYSDFKTTVAYTIKITDINNNIITTSIIQDVLKSNRTPIIDSILWDNDDQYENNSYTLTITAHDPDINDTLSYNVICNDDNISITQDTINNNVFIISYPEYLSNINITYTITVTDNHGASVTSIITKSVLNNNHAPIIDNVIWNDNNHKENNSYILTIDAHDPDDTDTITYNVTCDDTNVNIVQDTTNDNIFTITYPNYNIDTNVTYTITVTDNYNATDTITIVKLISNINHAPIIDNVTWNNNNHKAANSYILTINAHDPDPNDTISYIVTCDDSNINIVQDTNNKNIFNITYPSYHKNITITYTITVTDNHGLSTTSIITKLVINNNQSPIIDNLLWNDDNHKDNNSYTLTITAHDPDINDTITYSVTCDNNNVIVAQDINNKNIFNITYPKYNSNTNVTYTITVTDNHGASTTSSIVKLISDSNQAPIINSITWDNDNHVDNSSYILTIDAYDPDPNDTITYDVICNDNNVNIEQDINNKNIFTITYPRYLTNTIITYTIAVTDNHNLSTISNINKLIISNKHAPIIDDIFWNDNNHIAANNYILTINAHDPDIDDILSYNVICNDNNISIIQDPNNLNIFNVIYPDYNIDTNITYTITVTDSSELSTIYNIDKLVNVNTTNNNDRGIFSDGSEINNTIDYITISTLSNAQYFGDLTIARYALTSTSNNINNRGIFSGGFDYNIIDYVTISTLGDAQDFGDLTIGRYALAATSNGTNDRGIFGGGYQHKNYNTIDYITISILNNAQDFGNLSVGRSYLTSTSNSTNDRGVFGGGSNDIIDYVTISTLGNALDFGNLTIFEYGLTATSNGINNRGVFGGGYINTTNTINYITISTLGDAQDFGDLTIGRYGLAATSNSDTSRGVFGGGYNGNSYINTIDYITISTLGDAQDFGNLTNKEKGYFTATSNI